MTTGTKVGDEVIDRCPWSPTTALEIGTALHLASWWSDWKRFGIFPFGSDTLADEPSVVYDAIAACEQELGQVELERMKRTSKGKE